MAGIQLALVLVTVAALGQPQGNFLSESLKTGDPRPIRWSLHVSPARLQESQRLETSVSAMVGEREFTIGPKPAHMMFSLEIRDADNRIYRSDRAHYFQRRTDSSEVRLIQPVCIKPGEYQLTASLYDTGSKERTSKQTRLRVPGLRHDPLPGAWHDLPNVEFSRCDSTRLSLPLKAGRPVRIEVVMNESASRYGTGSLIPRLEVISNLAIPHGSMKVTLLDLERRRVSFTQEVVDRLDRRGVRAAWRENDPTIIDAQSLAYYKTDVQFFVSEIRSRLESAEFPETERVLIVLSAPRTFPGGEDLQPIQAAPKPGSRVFYIRCRWPVYAFQLPSIGFTGHPRRMRSDPNEDSLARTLKPLNPRLFDVTTPAQFRTALAALMTEITSEGTATAGSGQH